eukprot:3217492-Prymnesium_polylepis.2
MDRRVRGVVVAAVTWPLEAYRALGQGGVGGRQSERRAGERAEEAGGGPRALAARGVGSYPHRGTAAEQPLRKGAPPAVVLLRLDETAQVGALLEPVRLGAR